MDASQVKIYKQLGTSPNPATDTLLGTGDVNAKIPYLSWWRFNEGSWSGVTGEVIDAGGISHGKSYGAVISNSGRFGNCGLFDGVDDWVEIPIVDALKITAACTMEWWIFPTPPHLQNIGGLLFSISGKTSSRILVSDDGSIKCQIILSSGNNNYYPSTKATNNTWNHIVWRFDGSYQCVFLNGSKLTPQAASGTLSTGSSNLQVGWGYSTHAYYHYKGRIDGFRIWNSALSDDQCIALFSENQWLKNVSLSAGKHKVYAVAIDLAGNAGSVSTVYNLGRLPVPMYVSEPVDWYIGELNNTYLGEIDVSV